MRKLILYGLILASLIFFLKMIEYSFLVRELPVEVYIGIIVAMFTILGIWGGLKLTRSRTIMLKASEPQFKLNNQNLALLGISRREHEVLNLMAEGFSNRQIADRLLISLNTVKTHTSSLFVKMDVRRRTQAIQKAKDLHLIP